MSQAREMFFSDAINGLDSSADDMTVALPTQGGQ
jgi:hypothetical protein